VRSVIDEGTYGYEQVNVEKAEQDPRSFLNWVKQLVLTRKKCPEVGLGKMEILPSGSPHLFIYRLKNHLGSTLFIHNIAGRLIDIPASLAQAVEKARPLFGQNNFSQKDGQMIIKEYGYLWLKES